MAVYSTRSSDSRKHTTPVTSPLAFSSGCSHVCSVQVSVPRKCGAGNVRDCFHGWPSGRVSAENASVIESLFLCLCCRKCFQRASSSPLNHPRKFPLLFPSLLYPFLHPTELLQYQLWLLYLYFGTAFNSWFHLLPPGAWCFLAQVQVWEKWIICIFTKIYAISSLVYSHETGPAKYHNIKGSKSGSTWKSYKKVKSYTDSLNKITAAKSKWHRL